MAINHFAMAKGVIGDLDRIERVIRLLGFVNSAPGFRDAPSVVNGAPDLVVQVFGETAAAMTAPRPITVSSPAMPGRRRAHARGAPSTPLTGSNT